jgi:hypothetical protein
MAVVADTAIKGDATAELFFTGDALSLAFPSLAQVDIEVEVMGSEATIAVASSDGTGSSTTATAVGGGVWTIEEKVFFGTGWKASADPFTSLPQKRSLVIASDGLSALLQDMGSDAFVQVPMEDDESMGGEDDDSSAVAKSIGTSALLMMASLFFYF